MLTCMLSWPIDVDYDLASLLTWMIMLLFDMTAECQKDVVLVIFLLSSSFHPLFVHQPKISTLPYFASLYMYIYSFKGLGHCYGFLWHFTRYSQARAV